MDYDIHFSEDYRSTLKDILDNFKQNLIRHITDEIDRNKSDRYSPRQFSDVGFSVDGKTLSLKNISLVTKPDLMLESFDVDFKNMCLYIRFKFNDLQISTNYELNTITNGDTASKKGNMRFDLISTTVAGRVGIFFTEDSFSPITYDVKFNIGSLQVQTTPGENLEEFNLQPDNKKPIESKLLSLFWPDAKDFLYYEIYRLVSGNVVEYSVSELLIDEPEHLKEYAESKITHGNKFIETCLKNFNNVTEMHSDLKITKPLNLHIKGTHGGEMNCKEVKLVNATLKRIYNASYSKDDQGEHYYAHVAIENFQYVFSNCTLNALNDSYVGDITVKPYSNKISFKITVASDKKQLCIEFLQIRDWDFELAAPQDSSIVGWIRQQLKPYLTGYIWVNTTEILQKYVDQFNGSA